MAVSGAGFPDPCHSFATLGAPAPQSDGLYSICKVSVLSALHWRSTKHAARNQAALVASPDVSPTPSEQAADLTADAVLPVESADGLVDLEDRHPELPAR